MKNTKSDLKSSLISLINNPGDDGRRGGTKCQTCQLSNIEDINEALITYNSARESKKTLLTWGAFGRLYLKPSLGYYLDIRSAKRHLEKCLGKKVQP